MGAQVARLVRVYDWRPCHPAGGSSLQNFGDSVYSALPVAFGAAGISKSLMRTGPVGKRCNMTSNSVHGLANSPGEATRLICNGEYFKHESYSQSIQQRTTDLRDADIEDIGTLGESVPSISPFEVISFFTDLNSAKDNKRNSGGSDEGIVFECHCIANLHIPNVVNNTAGEHMHPAKVNSRQRRKRNGQQLWQFILDILLNDQYNPTMIKWVDREQGTFKFVQTKRVAQLWYNKRGGARTFEYLSRSLRHYYRKGIMSRIPNQRLVYKFESNATDWVHLVNSSKDAMAI